MMRGYKIHAKIALFRSLSIVIEHVSPLAGEARERDNALPGEFNVNQSAHGCELSDNPSNRLGAIRYDFLASVRPELVEGFVLQRKWFDKLTTNGLIDYLRSIKPDT